MQRTRQGGIPVFAVIVLLLVVLVGAAAFKYSHDAALRQQAAELAAAQEREAAERDAREEAQREASRKAAITSRAAEYDAQKKVWDSAAQSLKDILARWDDAARLAAAAPKVSLPGPVASLQQLRRDTAAVEVPECLAPARRDMLAGMDASIDGYIAFMAAKSDEQSPSVRAAFDLSRHEFRNLSIELGNCDPP